MPFFLLFFAVTITYELQFKKAIMIPHKETHVLIFGPDNIPAVSKGIMVIVCPINSLALSNRFYSIVSISFRPTFLGIPEGILADLRTSCILVGEVGDTGDVTSSSGPAPGFE